MENFHRFWNVFQSSSTIENFVKISKYAQYFEGLQSVKQICPSQCMCSVVAKLLSIEKAPIIFQLTSATLLKQTQGLEKNILFPFSEDRAILSPIVTTVRSAFYHQSSPQ